MGFSGEVPGRESNSSSYGNSAESELCLTQAWSSTHRPGLPQVTGTSLRPSFTCLNRKGRAGWGKSHTANPNAEVRLGLCKGLELGIEILQSSLCVVSPLQADSSFFPSRFLTHLCWPTFSAHHSWGRAFPGAPKPTRYRHSHMCQLTDCLSGAQIQAPVRESKWPACLKNSLLISSTPAGMRGHEVPTWLAGATPVRTAQRGILRQVGRRNVQ